MLSSPISVEHRTWLLRTWVPGPPISAERPTWVLSCRLHFPTLSPWTGTESPRDSGLQFQRRHHTRDGANPHTPRVASRPGGRKDTPIADTEALLHHLLIVQAQTTVNVPSDQRESSADQQIATRHLTFASRHLEDAGQTAATGGVGLRRCSEVSKQATRIRMASRHRQGAVNTPQFALL